ncbi:MAG TPA: GDSL-type esterase/lipase family protein [Candidatus Baltobacteraceae bacterium]
MLALAASLALAPAAQAQPSSSPTPPVAAGVVAFPCAVALPLSQDWGQVCTFAAANAALGPASDHRVVFFGDSITELWIQRDPTLFTDDILDRGISGQTTSQMLVRFREDVIALHPAIVQIMAGTNDIAGNTGPTTLAQIQGNVATMAEQARTHGITVILASIPPADAYFWQPSIDPRPSILALNAWMEEYARRNGLVYADYWSALSDDRGAFKPRLSLDGAHPSIAGYAAMRPAADAALARAMALRRGRQSSKPASLPSA